MTISLPGKRVAQLRRIKPKKNNFNFQKVIFTDNSINRCAKTKKIY